MGHGVQVPMPVPSLCALFLFIPQVHTLMVGAALATHREDSELVEVATKFLLRLGEPSTLE